MSPDASITRDLRHYFGQETIRLLFVSMLLMLSRQGIPISKESGDIHRLYVQDIFAMPGDGPAGNEEEAAGD
jgi:hypothetical protein